MSRPSATAFQPSETEVSAMPPPPWPCSADLGGHVHGHDRPEPSTGIQWPARPVEFSSWTPPELPHQKTVVAQLADRPFHGSHLGRPITGVTALILVLAANTAFNGFPVLGSILPKDGFSRASCTPAGPAGVPSNGSCPRRRRVVRRLRRRGDPPDPALHRRCFVSFTLSQIGMVRH